MKAVIFDMDGVLIDSEPMHVEVDRRLFDDLGITVTDEELNRFIGVSNTEMWSVLKTEHGLSQTVEELVDMSVQAKNQAIETMEAEPIDGIVELIDHLNEKGYSIGVGSSSPRVHIETVINRLGIVQYFQSISSGEEVQNGKPAPDVFLDAANKLGVNPSECYVIEDSTHGINAANAAGMISIGYRNPHNVSQSYDTADHVVDSIREILSSGIISIR